MALRNLSLALILFGFALFPSCFLSEEKTLPPGTGRSGDLVVVMDSAMWSGETGKQVMMCLAAPQEGLPQDEPYFNVIRVRKNEFKNIFKTTKNILLVDKSGSDGKPKFAVNQNLWAKNQLVLTLLAPNDQKASELMARNCESILDRYRLEEILRLQAAYSSLNSAESSAEMESKTGVGMSIPSDYKIVPSPENYCWIRKDLVHQGHQIDMGLLVQKIRYTSEDEFHTDSLASQITALCALVNGPEEGSHMKLFEELPPIVRNINFKKNYVKELRGLWNMYGAFMGGPYVSYSFVNQSGDSRILIFAYVFAPKFDKREYLRELEAIALSSLKEGGLSKK